jgi:hypothetical protein
MPLLKKRAPDELPVKFIEIDPDAIVPGDSDNAPYAGMERRRSSDGQLAHTH